MLTNNKVLSLVIPTYNRGGYLDAQIAWAVSSINDRWHIVELVICDNASFDDTVNVCEKWRKLLGDKLRVFRNDENVGLVKNCFLGLERAQGEFVWLVGDDDPMTPNGVERVTDIISRNNSLGLIHLNHRCVSSIDGSVIIPRYYDIKEDLVAPNNGAYHLSQILQSNHTGGFMFITANVVNRKLAIQFIKDNPPEDDLLLVYPVVLNVGLAALKGFYLTSDCVVDCAYYASSWLDKQEFVQYEAIPRTLIKLKKFGISNAALRNCMNSYFMYLESVKGTLFLLKKNPLYIFDVKFINWFRRRMLKFSLSRKINT
jgi:abequosyltransferase